MNSQLRSYLIFFAVSLAMAMLLAACASIGRPEGGPRDETPPEFVRSNPHPGKLRFDGKRIDLYFNENVQLDDAFNKVVVSPVQITPPQISANGHHVRVELRDTLIPDATYTIDFADAIKDLNEGNSLDGFAIDFSTGDSIDSLRISGMVLQARNLEPAQGMLVGAYSNTADSVLTTVPMERIARTDQYGRFTIRGLKPIPYRIFALNDVNRDYKWDRSEDVAFYDQLIVPTVENIEINDTLRAPDGVSDSIVARKGLRYLPNDVLLTWFNEGYSPQYLKDYSRPDRRRISVKFATAGNPDSLPTLTIAKGPMEGQSDKQWAKLHANATADTLEYWITDPKVLATDSLYIAMRYLRTDTLNNLSWTTDSLKFFYRDQTKKNKKKKEEENDSVPKIEFLNVTFAGGQSQHVYLPLKMQISQPIDTIDQAGYRLEIQQDTLWLPVPGVRFTPDSLNPVLGRVMDVKWEPGARYRLSIDSTAIHGIYDEWNRPIKQEFNVLALEDYSNLTFIVSPIKDNAFVELLNSGDEPVAVRPVVDGRAVFSLMNPGEYYARLFIDTDGDGLWTNGALSTDSLHLQPEEVYYLNKKLTLRKNWDIEENWDIYTVALDMQKPFAILKNKPKLKNGEKDSRDTSGKENDEDDDPWGDSYYNNGNPNSVDSRRNNSMGGRRGASGRGLNRGNDSMIRR